MTNPTNIVDGSYSLLSDREANKPRLNLSIQGVNARPPLSKPTPAAGLSSNGIFARDSWCRQARAWLVDRTMGESDGDGAGFGFVCAAVEHFSQVVMREDPSGPWVKFAVLFLSDDEALQ